MGPVTKSDIIPITKKERKILEFIRSAEKNRVTGLLRFEIVHGVLLNVRFDRGCESITFDGSTN